MFVITHQRYVSTPIPSSVFTLPPPMHSFTPICFLPTVDSKRVPFFSNIYFYYLIETTLIYKVIHSWVSSIQCFKANPTTCVNLSPISPECILCHHRRTPDCQQNRNILSFNLVVLVSWCHQVHFSLDI